MVVGSVERYTHVFVYGTLRSGGGAADLLCRCTHIGPATVNGTLYDLDGAYPALVLVGNGTVHGELWRCPSELLLALDRYEGVGDRLFRRVALQVGQIASWTYVAGPALAARLTPGRRIESGRWPPGPPPA